ncbi:PAS domain S-box protein (plasmid) [Hymenobacter tibetensis]|uniref:histidine kinase n=1 Tax=Hymenobacter tibetensis TaxID=497967 RepID=A0ABY4D691_9BACT|nr:PAS domain S-box protein [Hymenobacter tibetensis]UOG77687.1 PAS domain S-box protein [Hymenobacter tibetensis]
MNSTPHTPPDPSLQAALRAAEELLDTLPWGVLVVDEQRIVQRVNPLAARWCGTVPDALLGRALAEADLSPVVLTTLLQLLEPGAEAPREVWLPQSEQWIALSSTRRSAGWVIHGQDITPQKRREQQYQALAENTPDVLTRWGPDLRLRYANAAFADKTGVPLAELRGRTNREMGQPEAIAGPYMAALQRVFDTGQPQEHFNSFPTPHGEVYYSRLVPELRDGQVETVLGIARDITELKQAEAVVLRRVAAADAFRLQLADALGPLADPAAIQEAATRLTRQHFGADHCYYCELADGQGLIRHDAAADGRPSLAGTYALADFALLRAAIEAGQPLVVADVRTAQDVDEGQRQLCLRLQLLSYLNVPVLQNGQPAGVFSLMQSGPRQWTPDEVSLAWEVAERTWAAVERTRAEEALARSEEKYRTLFETMDQGYCLMELVLGERGQVVDIIYRDVNAAFEQQVGFGNVVGKRASEVFPRIEQQWVEGLTRVQQTGVPERVEGYNADAKQWFTVQYSRGGGPGSPFVAAVFTDITARKQQEQQQAFLLRFSDTLRAEMSAPNVADRALEMLGKQLRLDRCYIGLYDLAQDRGLFPHQVGNHRIPSLPAEVRLSDFPDALRVASDRTLRIDDLAHTAGLSDTDRQNLGALGLRALVAATLRRGDAGPQWAIVALSAEVRHWTPGEVALLEEATERTWAALERARADEALRESEARFRAVANLVPDLLWRSTPDSDTTWYNQRWYEYTGQTPAEAARYGWTDALHPDDRAESSHRYHTAVVSGQPLVQEYRIRSAQGEYRWFQVQALPLLSEHGTVTAWYGAATDIHARKLAEQDVRHTEERHRAELEQQVAARTRELQQNRRLLQAVFDASPTAIVVMRLLHDAAGQAEDFEILIFNAFNQQVVGRDDLVGQRFTALFPQTVPHGILARLLHVATTGEPADFEQWYEGEGMQHWFRHIMVRQDGLLVLTSEVITARKTAEQERARTLRLLEQAEAVAGLGSWDYDLLSQEFRWSDGLYQLFGLPLGQPVRPNIYLDYVVDEDRVRAEDLVHRVQTGDGSFEDTLRLRVDGQVKTVRIKSVVLHNAAGQPVRVLGVDLDLSELQRLEADNLRLRLTQQQALFEAVQAAQETERRRMAESLHNGIGQILFATKLRLDQLHAPVLHTLPTLVAARHEADQLLNEAIRQTRVLSHELVPLTLEQFGLPVALRDIGRKMSTPHLRFTCHVLLDEEASALSPTLQLALYRMAQELALNISKHAQGATEANLELETMPGWVLLRAEDNGPGFGAKTTAAGLGLRSIRDRVALLGGQLETGSVPAGGAFVRIRIPLPNPSTS